MERGGRSGDRSRCSCNRNGSRGHTSRRDRDLQTRSPFRRRSRSASNEPSGRRTRRLRTVSHESTGRRTRRRTRTPSRESPRTSRRSRSVSSESVGSRFVFNGRRDRPEERARDLAGMVDSIICRTENISYREGLLDGMNGMNGMNGSNGSNNLFNDPQYQWQENGYAWVYVNTESYWNYYYYE